MCSKYHPSDLVKCYKRLLDEWKASSNGDLSLIMKVIQVNCKYAKLLSIFRYMD